MDRRDELLKKSWAGEILGRSFFAGLSAAMPDDERMWRLLTSLEETTGALVAPVAEKHGIGIDVPALEATGAGFAGSAAESGREALFKQTLEVVAEFLESYRELAALLADDEAWLGQELVEHEQALAYYIERELAGDQGGDTKVLEFLARHGADIPAGA